MSSSTHTSRAAALTKIVEAEIAFAALLTDEERLLTGNDCSDGTGPLSDACFSLWSRLQDLKESAQEAADRGEPYPVSFAKEQWLDMIATYAGIILRRFAAGELLLDSEGVTAKCRDQIDGIRKNLEIIYGSKLARLEARKEVDFS